MPVAGRLYFREILDATKCATAFGSITKGNEKLTVWCFFGHYRTVTCLLSVLFWVFRLQKPQNVILLSYVDFRFNTTENSYIFEKSRRWRRPATGFFFEKFKVESRKVLKCVELRFVLWNLYSGFMPEWKHLPRVILVFMYRSMYSTTKHFAW